MHPQFLIGAALVFTTTIIHSACTLAALRTFKAADPQRWARSHMRRVLLVAALVLLMFTASIVEAALWGVTFLAVGAISGLEQALYFSIVTYTTLGYGDVVASEGWRLLASFEAANGIIMFGWTTALVVALVQRIASHEQDRRP